MVRNLEPSTKDTTYNEAKDIEMETSVWTKVTLIVSGLGGVSIGLAALFIPHPFHASAGVVLGDDVNLLNEMRAPSGALLVFGIYVLWCAYRANMAAVALSLSAVVYLSYGVSRIVSLVADGMPSNALLAIMAYELALGVICAAIVWNNQPTLKSPNRDA